MTSIGIIGTGISGLTLALTLQQHGIECVMYADRTSGEIRDGRLPNTVVRYGGTIPRERALGVNHWDGTDLVIERAYISALGTPISFYGPMPNGGSAVDFRVFLPRLLEDFENRGGSVVHGRTTPELARQLVERHDLVVVASGRDTAESLFPRDPARSTHSTPQRMLCAGFWHGIDELEPRGITFALAPGAGEIFQVPALARDGQVSGLLFEAVPGGPLAPIAEASYDADPGAFEALALRLVHDYAPRISERISEADFHLTGPLDVLQGSITPTVRQAWRELAPGRFAIALGDAWIVNDPITGQGANLGSACAAELAALIVEHHNYDEMFCRKAERRLWALAEPVCQFTNAFMEPPPPHVQGVLAAATEDQGVADAFVTNFGDAGAMCEALATEEGAAAFLQRARDARVARV
jgi:2-polyprenyl-6-methoxyphenol hydroxylase-like FAD-dependent oxidoreductase